MATLNHSLLCEVNHSFELLLQNESMQGDRVKEAMDSKGWTPADLRRALVEKGYEVTEQAIGKWLTGAAKNIKAEYMFAIEDLTGYRCRYMAEGKLPKTMDRQVAMMANIMGELSDENKSALIAAGSSLAKPKGNHGHG